jgi:hypothetical protein
MHPFLEKSQRSVIEKKQKKQPRKQGKPKPKPKPKSDNHIINNIL